MIVSHKKKKQITNDELENFGLNSFQDRQTVTSLLKSEKKSILWLYNSCFALCSDLNQKNLISLTRASRRGRCRISAFACTVKFLQKLKKITQSVQFFKVLTDLRNRQVNNYTELNFNHPLLKGLSACSVSSLFH